MFSVPYFLGMSLLYIFVLLYARQHGEIIWEKNSRIYVSEKVFPVIKMGLHQKKSKDVDITEHGQKISLLKDEMKKKSLKSKHIKELMADTWNERRQWKWKNALLYRK